MELLNFEDKQKKRKEDDDQKKKDSDKNRLTPDKVLGACQGHFDSVLIIGYDSDNMLKFLHDDSLTLAEANYMMDRLKNYILTPGPIYPEDSNDKI